MKKNILILIIVLFSGLLYNAQTPTLIGNYIYSTKGAGAAGVPNFTYNIPAGKNRVMIVTAYFERDHIYMGQNYPGTSATDIPLLRVGTNDVSYYYYNFRYYGYDNYTPSYAYMSSSIFSYRIADSQNLPVGNTNFSFPSMSSKLPQSDGDDVIVSVSVFENASQSNVSSSLIGNNFEAPSYSTTFSQLTSTAPTAPLGTSTTNIVYLAHGAVTEETLLSNSGGWIDVNSLNTTNYGGQNYAGFPDDYGFKPNNEGDGISMKTVYQSGIAGNPTVSFSRSSFAKIMSYQGRITPILPLARPSVSGTIYNDSNGPANIDGTATSGGGLFINVYTETGTFVQSVTVAADGTFTIPMGILIENSKYKFVLNKNQASISNPNPAQQLNANWTTVGESLTSTGNDGLANGILETSIGNVQITGLRFGIATCSSGTNAPNINAATNYTVINSSYTIPCGSTTANLSSLAASNKPSQSTVTLTWHTATPATSANKISNITALTGTTKYYAAFFDSVNNCYSPTKEIIVYAPICAANDNYAATPVTYGVGGTLPNIFANDTYNGSVVSVPLSTVAFKEVLWVHANAQVNISSDGKLVVSASTLPGIYTYTYSITDLDPDGVEDSNISYATVTFRVVPDSDGDGVNDEQDVDDDNDGILDTAECSNTIADMGNASSAGKLLNIQPSFFGLALNTKNTDITRDLSNRFGYPANSGAVIISIKNASVHPTEDAWWTKNGEQPSVWNVTGTMSAFVLMSQNTQYYGNDSKTIHIYDAQPVIPLTVPGMTNQTAVAGQWSITDTPTQKTLNDLNNNTSTMEEANWRFANMNFGAKSFGFSTTTAFANPTYAVHIYLECDSDGDGIPNRLDLDSDADGCSDALEGGADITVSQLVTAAGTLSAGSTSVNQNLCASTNCVSKSGSNSGLPQFSTLPTGYSNANGQSTGDSQNGAINNCYCTQPPSAGTSEITKVGISVQQKQAGWPENIPNGQIVLESKEKGFVITRVPHVSFVPQTTDSIASPFAGMLVYDIQDKCVKLFNGINWKCIQRSCNTTSN